MKPEDLGAVDFHYVSLDFSLVNLSIIHASMLVLHLHN